MISLDNAVVSKGMIFAGCSFTWGQGLYYYSNLDTLQEPPPDQYNESLVRESHLEYAATIRYPRLVARYFNSFEFVHPRNGGSNEGAVDYWESCFTKQSKHDRTKYNDQVRPLKYSEISHVCFQLTQWQRDNFLIEVNGRTAHIPYHCVNQDEFRDLFFEWLDLKGYSIETFTQLYIQNGLDNVKRFLQNCEDNGVKTLIFTWPSDYLRFIDKDPWLKERLLEFSYKGKLHRSIEDLMFPGSMQTKGYNPELTIKWDESNFKETPKDHHPSKRCHEVIAENIINKLSQV